LALHLRFSTSWLSQRNALPFKQFHNHQTQNKRYGMGRDGSYFSKSVMGPDGMPLTLADLPPMGATRWVARRKAQVVAAVRGGLLSLEQASERYALTAEEFMSWRNAVDRFGLDGLRATHARDHMHASR
jgi:hypothetical protein